MKWYMTTYLYCLSILVMSSITLDKVINIPLTPEERKARRYNLEKGTLCKVLFIYSYWRLSAFVYIYNNVHQGFTYTVYKWYQYNKIFFSFFGSVGLGLRRSITSPLACARSCCFRLPSLLLVRCFSRRLDLSNSENFPKMHYLMPYQHVDKWTFLRNKWSST